MANTKEILTRMNSIRDTMKITNAMYMISSSKLKKAKKDLEATEPFFYTLQDSIGRILRHVPDMQNIYFRDLEGVPIEKLRVGYLVITADKGLAGGYNHNILKVATEHIEQHPNSKLYVIGEIGRHYFEKRNISIDKQFHYTVQNPTLGRARAIASEILEDYSEGEIDVVYVVYTRMENAMTEEVDFRKLIPLEKPELKISVPISLNQETVAFVPSPEALMERIVPSFVAGFLYGALVEAFCSEQNARMVAMQTATESGKEMLHELDILYNRARQAAITQEITEVVAGAKAQKKKKKS